MTSLCNLQEGIKIASGDYIFNLDGDDAVCEDALQSAYEIIKKFHPDMVSFSYKRYVDGVIGEIVEDLPDEGLYNKVDMEKHIYHSLLSNKNMKNL